jgi:hypothetical protein
MHLSQVDLSRSGRNYRTLGSIGGGGYPGLRQEQRSEKCRSRFRDGPSGPGERACGEVERPRHCYACSSCCRPTNQGRGIMLPIAGTLAMFVASLALDVWIWVPRSDQ